MQTLLAIGEAPHLALGLWVLLAICFLGAFGVGMYGVKDVLRDEWDAYQADRARATAKTPEPAKAKAHLKAQPSGEQAA